MSIEKELAYQKAVFIAKGYSTEAAEQMAIDRVNQQTKQLNSAKKQLHRRSHLINATAKDKLTPQPKLSSMCINGLKPHGKYPDKNYYK